MGTETQCKLKENILLISQLVICDSQEAPQGAINHETQKVNNISPFFLCNCLLIVIWIASYKPRMIMYSIYPHEKHLLRCALEVQKAIIFFYFYHSDC